MGTSDGEPNFKIEEGVAESSHASRVADKGGMSSAHIHAIVAVKLAAKARPLD